MQYRELNAATELDTVDMTKIAGGNTGGLEGVMLATFGQKTGEHLTDPAGCLFGEPNLQAQSDNSAGQIKTCQLTRTLEEQFDVSSWGGVVKNLVT